MIPQQVRERQWATVSADIFYYKGRDYLLVVDCFSKYPVEVARFSHKDNDVVTLEMRDMFTRHIWYLTKNTCWQYVISLYEI